MVLYLKKLLTISKKKYFPEDLQLRFLEHLERYLMNGYSLLEALERVKWDKQLKSTAETIISSLKRGETIDIAFDHANFHYTIIAYLFFVKEHGNLLDSIENCIQASDKRIKYKQKMLKIIRYPLLLLFIFTTLLYFIKQSVLPTFMNIFQYHVNVSNAAKYVLLITDYIVPSIIILLCFVLLFMIWWQRLKKKYNIQTRIKIYKMIPIYRNFVSMQTSFQLATHVSMLLQTGMSLNGVLHYMSEQKHLPITSYYSKLMSNTLEKGMPITTLLPHLAFIEKQLADIFQKNSDKQTLEKDLSSYAEMLANELHRKTMNLLTIIQPVLFILIAILIILLYLLLMWPMIQVINQL